MNSLVKGKKTLGKKAILVGLSDKRGRGRPRKYDIFGNPVEESTPRRYLAFKERSPSPGPINVNQKK